ncbi:TrkH family potassium uptake protein [Clostridium kluyveri]|uniref:Trk family potassium uptake protein n=1 Tax=Clostridium kluyveri TaxID=1534 RepID=A0A1L5F9N6_CLOKL|nr:TrkH family potassium uptake protein [Clostridium kluyveri]APM39726.1 Trk family potassium uptake protein [Clostridium kluyveri]UZQ50112.1 TrkH family potassium uptake protein [Clostridium kluyveri]
MKLKSKPLFKMNEIQILILGFLLIIIVGAILLWLPLSSENHTYTNFIDSLFVATSATCVTGLITVDTGTHWNYFGKTVILALIQIGGLGFMAFSTLIALILGRKITLKERLLIHESLNSFNIQGLVKMSKYILLFTFLVEAVGAVILSSQFVPQFGVYRGLFYSIFHSVSAFCNAGIDLIGEGRSLMPYYNNFTIIFTISVLIIIGGLGFYVWQEIYNLSFKYTKRLSLNSKVCITMAVVLLASGTILFFLFEFNNPATMKHMTSRDKLLSSFFASVSVRTAGFNSISISDMSESSKFLTIVFMFIGGAPGSTAGGIKTTTAALIIMTAVSVIKGRQETEIYKRTIKKDLVYKAIVIFIVYIILIFISALILGVTEKDESLETIIFECISAIGTSGLSFGTTPDLSIIGKIVIIISMFFGRLGGLTIILSMINRKIPKSIKYPEDKILIG